ncbi:MAG: ABC transporter ATP-binding protein [Clostridiales bacterium]|jgi:ABC-type lipoprotein export system ATPase subunit|nr:ABC transporter ATP-binding protein [Clostridiales bacterium]
MLKAEKLNKIIKNKSHDLHIVKNVSFTVDEGSISSIMGPSGCGKTTLLGMLGGIDAPNSGRVLLNGESLYEKKGSDLNAFRVRNIGYVLQDHHLVNELNCYENILLPLLFANEHTYKENEKRVGELIEALKLSKVKNRFPYQMSGGEKQRTAMARALTRRPRLLLADEPTGNLDQMNAQNVMKLLNNIVETFKVTVIIVTHDKNIADQCGRVFQMLDGEFVQ